ncbi:DUF397 domain-containing protein [Streptomyces sp. DH8]|uniref:DUF397 domain-containing protein n=1 Tax=Streptomyces sp. DH8 TaxID=2857008 RepID=UPI001E4EDA6A|nr:DUF397 domain-containing protein [Streptomyces sp. DH8]
MNRAAHSTSHRIALDWFKSSYSNGNGGDCVEVAYHWRKSSYSDGDGGACVEVAAHPAAVHVRDSKVSEGPVLTVAPAAWSAFVEGSSAAL